VIGRFLALRGQQNHFLSKIFILQKAANFVMIRQVILCKILRNIAIFFIYKSVI
jgi:hypothetical protein